MASFLLIGTMNLYLVQRADLESIAGPKHGRRAVFLDDCRTQPVESGLQCVAVKDLRVYPTTSATEIGLPRVQLFGRDGGAWETCDVRTFQAREGRKVKRLKFRWCFGVRMAIAPPVIVFESVANRRRVFQSGDRHFYIVPLTTVAHLSVTLEKNVTGSELGFESFERLFSQRAEDFAEGADGFVVEQADKSLRRVDPGIGEQHADGREVTRLGWDHHGWDRQLMGQRASVERSAATITDD